MLTASKLKIKQSEEKREAPPDLPLRGGERGKRFEFSPCGG